MSKGPTLTKRYYVLGNTLVIRTENDDLKHIHAATQHNTPGAIVRQGTTEPEAIGNLIMSLYREWEPSGL